MVIKLPAMYAGISINDNKDVQTFTVMNCSAGLIKSHTGMTVNSKKIGNTKGLLAFGPISVDMLNNVMSGRVSCFIILILAISASNHSMHVPSNNSAEILLEAIANRLISFVF